MALLVLKFGGTSVADIDRIRNVAAHVKREADAGHACAVVVSAMAGAHQPARRAGRAGLGLQGAEAERRRGLGPI